MAECRERDPRNLAQARETLPRVQLIEAQARETLPIQSCRSRTLTANKQLRAIGIDLGLKVFAYCSDGTVIPNERIATKAMQEIRRRQKALARCRRGSNRRRKVRERLARMQRKVADSRSTWLHQQSAALVERVDVVVTEDLSIKNMMASARGTIQKPGRNVRAKAGLNRSIADAAWARFLTFVAYKAERAGKQLISVDSRNTSQRCSGCHELVPKSLAIRTHACPHCGLVIDRDWNASINILRAGLPAGWPT